MNPDPEVAEALERLDRALEHPRILAAKAVAEFRGRELSQPWINRHDDKGAPTLNPDAVLGHDHHDRRLGRKV